MHVPSENCEAANTRRFEIRIDARVRPTLEKRETESERRAEGRPTES